MPGVNWPHLIAQTIAFALVGGLLYGFAYTPLIPSLACRGERVTRKQA